MVSWIARIIQEMKKIFSYVLIPVIVITPLFAFAASFDHDLHVGIYNSAEVTMLQEFLSGQGLYSGPVTGNFLSRTKQAVISFQEQEGITPAQGYVGQKTRIKLNEALLAGARSLDSQIAALKAKIEELQKTLAGLIKNQASIPAPSVSASPVPSVSESPSPSSASESSSTPILSPAPMPKLLITGSSTQAFPSSGDTVIKLGEFTISNTLGKGTGFAWIKLDIYDGMDTALNRGKTIVIKLRNGTTTSGNTISDTDYVINNDPPTTGGDHRRQLEISFPISLKSAETGIYSLWIESLDYVVGGYLRVLMFSASVNDGVIPEGGFNFNLSR